MSQFELSDCKVFRAAQSQQRCDVNGPPLLTRTGHQATRSVAMGRSCIGNDDRHNPSKTKLVESALLALEI
jgi:hypothetical protein